MKRSWQVAAGIDLGGNITSHACIHLQKLAMAPPKPIHLTEHAAAAVAERKLLLRWISEAARDPEWIEVDPQWTDVERRFRAIPEFGTGILRAACLESPTETLTIIAFVDRKARRPK